MREESGLDISILRVDGGASANDFLMQFQSDISDAVIERPECIETTALGAAYLAGLATGFWQDTAQIEANWKCSHTFTPSMSAQDREKLLRGWKRAVRCALAYAEED